ARVVPAYFHGTRPFAGMVRDFMQFDRVTLQFGVPIQFDDLKGRHRDPQARDIALARIMAAIAALRDETEGADPLKVGHGY
ncbi:MAG TPA: hypothetical protein VHM90_04420, partial [Phycisphaerae bacterium]|nr:hypothetical protein [Phycisphaerae bacterium]